MFVNVCCCCLLMAFLFVGCFCLLLVLFVGCLVAGCVCVWRVFADGVDVCW